MRDRLENRVCDDFSSKGAEPNEEYHVLFPDQPHVDRICEALWRRAPQAGGAAVLVGAGMSANARPLDPGRPRPPSWATFTRVLVEHLYPDSPAGEKDRRTAGTSSYLRLAQEYLVTFGRPALERRIAETVRDERFEPGPLHELLLELPWADVLTTNWDTLLERTRPPVPRTYDLVATITEIQHAHRPRIVKLHGSLPNHSPLLVTEDDFRRYPVEFAPFVNLAQQVLMENVLVLIGFSGDDPNFLFWSGWVRDHLGVWAPPIYLAGWLELSSPQRRLLESRNVNPIDLSRLPYRDNAPLEVRRREGLHWLLLKLRQSEPYRAATWPQPQPPIPVDTRWPPFTTLAGANPLGPPREPLLRYKGHDDPPEKSLLQLREHVDIWRKQRSFYPGWVIAPSRARVSVGIALEYRLHVILDALQLAPPVEALLMLRELVWRFAISLTPLLPEVVERIDAVLAATDPRSQPSFEPPAADLPFSTNPAELRSAWIEVAVERLRYAREQDEQFAAWAGRLEPYLSDEPEIAARLHYERCLDALSHLNLQHVESAVQTWETDRLDPYWTIRKAGLLAELGRADEAYDTAIAGLRRMLREAPRDHPEIAALSREDWARFFLKNFNLIPFRRRRLAAGLPEFPSSQEVEKSLPPTARAEEEKLIDSDRSRLLSFGCDAVEETLKLSAAIAGPPPGPPPTRSQNWTYDQQIVTYRHIRFGSSTWREAVLPAERARRLVEEAGLGAFCEGPTAAGDLLSRAASWLLRNNSATSRALLLRAVPQPDSEPFEEVFCRARIALLTDHEATLLLQRSRAIVDQGIRTLSELGKPDLWRANAWQLRVSFGLEVVSRLALRQHVDQVRELLTWAVSLAGAPAVRQRFLLVQRLTPLLSRVLDSLGTDLSAADALALWTLPLPDRDGAVSEPAADWLEPAALLGAQVPSPPAPTTLPDVRTVIQRLLSAAAQDRPAQYRRGALLRLRLLDRWGWLTVEERHAFAEALWRPPVGADGLPAETGLPPSEFARLPEPHPGQAAEIFRAVYLTEQGRAFEARLTIDYLRNLLNAASPGPRVAAWLRLTPDEADQIARKLLTWWRDSHPEEESRNRPFLHDSELPPAVLVPLADVILPALVSPVEPEPAATHAPAEASPELSVAERLHRMILCLLEQNLPVEITFPELTRLLPQHAADLTGRLRQSLASSEEGPSKAAVYAVVRWWDGALAGRLSPPPEDLLVELALIIRGRRSSNLTAALRAVGWIVSGRTLPGVEPNPQALSDTFLDLLVVGLEYLKGSAVYSAVLLLTGSEAQKMSFEILEQRKLCVALARALAAYGRAKAPAVQHWIEEAASDPFADVRRAEPT